MTCTPCQERRAKLMQAWQERKIAEAVREMAKGVGEILKGKGDGETGNN